MEIDIVGEDQVTQEIIERLVKDYRRDITIKNRLPSRGSQIKNNAPKYNNLGSPIFLLTDLDHYHCPPSLIKDFLDNAPLKAEMLLRVAWEEAETWLMADRKGFSHWLGTSVDLIPEPEVIDRKTGAVEIIFPLKPSLYMMLNIASKSHNNNLKLSLTPISGAKKGPAYNSAILPFIKNVWNIEEAAKNSNSLARTIARLQAFQQ
ncbi:hypothetical protein HYN48_13745 [Flavobacterium magnum]|uniref:Uncharacterized protein n=1 Tax=Flavobacterium magnum TaxID=2162713 RepID=A0A2S0RK17_9FLAO|nr:hypothetical protein [Flavobacterium magnum]AWA31062.1 hypothetical protein HYN48_13745 [Flavobacterium magnum]